MREGWAVLFIAKHDFLLKINNYVWNERQRRTIQYSIKFVLDIVTLVLTH